MHRTFHTPRTVSLTLEIGAGEVDLTAAETDETSVDIEGSRAEDVTVEQRGDEIVIVQRNVRGAFFGPSRDLRVAVTLPAGSHLAARIGSARLGATGRYGAARIKSGSGQVRVAELTADSVIETGSGEIQVGLAAGSLQVRAGSGDVTVGTVAGVLVVTSGSGDVRVGVAESTATIRSGSGDLHVRDAHTDVGATSGSGDVVVEQLRRGVATATTASGDVTIGVPAGVPVWTDIRSVAGEIRSNLQGAGRPAEGQDHIEIHAVTVSGDVDLSQLAPEGA